MAALNVGDRVKIKTRDVTAQDEKTGLYYAYFGGLTGTVDKIYDDGSVCVDIDIDSLRDEARERHLAMQESERERWLESLSGEARSRLTPEQRKLKISYKILVSKKDLEPHKGDDQRGRKESSAAGESKASDDAPPTRKKGPLRAPEPEQEAESGPQIQEEVEEEIEEAEEAASKRLSEADLAAKEEEYLRSLRGRS